METSVYPVGGVENQTGVRSYEESIAGAFKHSVLFEGGGLKPSVDVLPEEEVITLLEKDPH